MSDFPRIAGLEKRPPISDASALAKIVNDMSGALRTFSGEMTLNSIQALALREAQQTGGLLANIAVGKGKTLLVQLLPRVLNAIRAVILVPASLVAQLLQKNFPELRRHWRLLPLQHFLDTSTPLPVPGAYVVSHEQLSDRRYARVLEVLKPDLVLGDEAQLLLPGPSKRSSRGTRLDRYYRAYPETRFGFVSGTLFRESVCDPALLAELVFKDRSPWPLNGGDLYRMSQFLDGENLFAREPSGLSEAYPVKVEGDAPLRHFYYRIRETPGYVASGEDDLGVSLLLRNFEVTVGDAAKTALKTLRKKWELPDGTELCDALEFYRHAYELSQGFYYRWAWPNGVVDEEWMSARSSFEAVVRRALAKGTPGMDSRALLIEAAERGEWTPPEYFAWKDVSDRKRPPTETVWIDDFLATAVKQWTKDNVGIVWTEHAAVGPALSRATGLPYFGAGADEIRDEDGSRSIIASLAAHGTGKELQVFNKMLFLCPSPNPTTWEQGIGREHRQGQKSDLVTVDVCLHTQELVKAFRKAEDGARFLEQMAPGSERQKILYADRDF